MTWLVAFFLEVLCAAGMGLVLSQQENDKVLGGT